MVVILKLYTKMHNFNKVPYKYLVNTLLKLRNYFCPSFPRYFTHFTQECENSTTKRNYDKHSMFRATNLHQPRKFYTAAGDDG